MGAVRKIWLLSKISRLRSKGHSNISNESKKMKNYLILFIILLLLELAIAYFQFNSFIRGFLGDVLVILLLYSFLKIFIKNNVLKTAVSVLAFAYFVELLQLFKLVEKLNIQSEILLIIFGSVFDFWDLLAYFLGFLLILLIEKFS
ncbi:hypothetical protein AEQU1_01806 [Aequorivita sp. CIP111184]|nr:hypothetical protein AEQU1_01806 [Aequorivita sp. CIP111184]